MPDQILLVDDDKDFRGEFKDCLGEYEIIDTGSGEEALKILKKPNAIDLVVLDIKMPGISGIDVLKEIRNVSPELGIIILTGYSSKDVAIEALKGHADDYIEKPFDVNKVKQVIEKVLETKRGESDVNATDTVGKIEKIKSFIERNCYKKINLKDAANAVFLSPKYLSRIFKEFTGVTFSEYKLKIKTEKAKELLTGSGLNVNQISDKLGYENVESFIRQFKKLAGATPTEYRKKISKKGKFALSER